MKDLVGHECCIHWLPEHTQHQDWPMWVTVEAVSMPMVKIKGRWAEEGIWVNASLIKSISINKRNDPAPWWVRLLSMIP